MKLCENAGNDAVLYFSLKNIHKKLDVCRRVNERRTPAAMERAPQFFEPPVRTAAFCQFPDIRGKIVVRALTSVIVSTFRPLTNVIPDTTATTTIFCGSSRDTRAQRSIILAPLPHIWPTGSQSLILRLSFRALLSDNDAWLLQWWCVPERVWD